MKPSTRLRLLRELCGITQAELARAAELDQTALCRFEQGDKGGIGKNSIEPLAKAFGVLVTAKLLRMRYDPRFQSWFTG